MGKIVSFDHPLIIHKLTLIRDIRTGNKEFRELIREVSTLMAYEVTRSQPLETVRIETPICAMDGKIISGRKPALVPILRAGLGMVEGFLSIMPNAKIGHVGLYRDKVTLLPVEYYCKLPSDIGERDVILLDPMLATGGSSCAAIDLLKKKGASGIKLVSIISCPEGLKALTERHPDVDVFVGAIDERLNDHAYIVPGLGDAGDRLFGTE
jgi:uracil phosphoribosyltransferase